MDRSDLCWLMILWFCLISSASALSGNETDMLSLLELKAKIEDDPLGLLSSWNNSVQLCSWPGVTCGRRHQRVTMLNLRSWRLEGPLSPRIGNLSFLRVLDLGDNSFNLEIPQEIGRLFRLKMLQIGNNSFSGGIPANITRCSRLRYLSLYNNKLTGEIPNGIGSLLELRTVMFSNNNLGTEIPASVGNLSFLEDLFLSNNNLQGIIPASLGRLLNLKNLVLQSNDLTGTIPVSLYNVSTITTFSVNDNKLEGSVPPNVGLTLPNLQYFFLQSNNFSGSIPVSISNSSSLVLFQININNFIGKVPSFASSRSLKGLGLSTNNLGYDEKGDLNFIRDLVNCTKLETLMLTGNNLGGEIPQAISNMTRLRRLGLGTNKISGKIPSGIENLVDLEALGLHNNHLFGPIPRKIGQLRKIYILTFENNKLSGTIPLNIGNITMLSRLSLAGNHLQGVIPPSLGECKYLQMLTLAENSLSGLIPSQLMNLTSLSAFLNLSRNQLNGSIPTSVGKLAGLQTLDMSDNKLSGEMPKSFGRCASMEYLYLQGNFLRGSIPRELDSLRGLRVLDFSRNNFSGTIPEYFESFRGFEYVNFSFNEFEGEVPLLGVFGNSSQFSVAGNTKLCGGLPELKLSKCPSNSNKGEQLSTRAKIIVIVCCAIVGLMVPTFLAIVTFRSRKKTKPIVEAPIGVCLPRVSYGDLCKATDTFSPRNLIGIGSFGSVYKGILNREERRVAVKILNFDTSRALKSFTTECESLGGIRHRNILKLVTVCSSTDFLGNDFKALVYEFMQNGSLEEWLHSDCRDQDRSRQVNLMQRINIAIDVASALDYLHNHSFESIVHSDVKSSNVLLDDQMVAHVGDFGLAKLVRTSVSFSSSNQTSSIGVNGTIGYIAPEYAMGSKVSTLGDIYSYGILLLEMFTGKRPTDDMFKDDFNLSNFASTASEDHIDKIVDPILLQELTSCDGQTQVARKCLISIVEIGVVCSSKCPNERRNMSEVSAELHRIRDILDAKNHASRYVY